MSLDAGYTSLFSLFTLWDTFSWCPVLSVTEFHHCRDHLGQSKNHKKEDLFFWLSCLSKSTSGESYRSTTQMTYSLILCVSESEIKLPSLLFLGKTVLTYQFLSALFV